MKRLQLHKFFKEKTEFRYEFNDEINQEDVIFFVYFADIEEFTKMLGSSAFDDDGISCAMKDGYFVFWASSFLPAIFFDYFFEKE